MIQPSPLFRLFIAAFAALSLLGFVAPRASAAAADTPIVFWTPDGLEPGSVTLLYGGHLAGVQTVRVWRLPDGAVGTPSADAPLTGEKSEQTTPALQPSDASVKFQIPATLTTGLFAFRLSTTNGTFSTPPTVLNRPRLWFLQPTHLVPGCQENETPAGVGVQIIGKDFVLPGSRAAARVAVRAASGGVWRILTPTKTERFSLRVTLPRDFPSGKAIVRVHNGYGAAAGWGEPLTVTIKAAQVWPATVFNVRDFGAKGDDVADDTPALQSALAAAEKNGGGVVYLPWGTYRMTHYICIPPHTVLRGEGRDSAVLKWPVDVPLTLADFTPAAIYGAAPYGVENLSLIARKVDTLLLDMSYDRSGIPTELGSKMQPWGAARDVFLRHVNFQHWLLAGHPDRQPELWAKKYTGDGAYNFRCGRLTNFEVSDCQFQGGSQMFSNVRNARVTGNEFSNEMGYCWTVLGGGARYEVCENNEIRASSSWGYGNDGMQYVYSAHNISRNFVRGEREAMTLDISALPTARPVSQYWGSPAVVGGEKGKPFLRFPVETNGDGFKADWTPGCFRGGILTVRAYSGGANARQTRKILDNTTDTVFLDRPFDTPPDTTPRRGYMEIAPRIGGTAAWLGRPISISGKTLTVEPAKAPNWVPQEFVDMAVMVLDGPGAGQYRVVTANTTSSLTVDRAWDVPPTAQSTIGVWSLMRHMIVADSTGYDTSAFGQLWGSFYDFTIDGCTVERNQGMWGQSGWFVQFRHNDVAYANTYHPGIGPHGDNPEGNLPFSFVGLIDGNLRIGKFGEVQYGFPGGKALFVNEVVPAPVPGARGCIVRGNVLRYNQRIAFPPWSGPPPKDPGFDRILDVVIDHNHVEHSSVGVQIGPMIGNVLLSGNVFQDVAIPLMLAKPQKVLSLEKATTPKPTVTPGIKWYLICCASSFSHKRW